MQRRSTGGKNLENDVSPLQLTLMHPSLKSLSLFWEFSKLIGRRPTFGGVFLGELNLKNDGGHLQVTIQLPLKTLSIF